MLVKQSTIQPNRCYGSLATTLTMERPLEIRRRPPNPKVKVAHLEYAVPPAEAEPRNILEEIVCGSCQERCHP